MLTSEILLNKIKDFEGCKLEAYQDAAGVWTIGYGHTLGVNKGDRCVQYYADEMLKQDIEYAERQVLKLDIFKNGTCKYQGQLDALVSFVFNLGIGNLKTSTLLQLIAAKMPREAVFQQWRRWVYANGVQLKGLKARRQWEMKRFYDNTDTIEEVEAKMAENAAFEKRLLDKIKEKEC